MSDKFDAQDLLMWMLSNGWSWDNTDKGCFLVRDGYVRAIAPHQIDTLTLLRYIEEYGIHQGKQSGEET